MNPPAPHPLLTSSDDILLMLTWMIRVLGNVLFFGLPSIYTAFLIILPDVYMYTFVPTTVQSLRYLWFYSALASSAVVIVLCAISCDRFSSYGVFPVATPQYSAALFMYVITDVMMYAYIIFHVTDSRALVVPKKD